MATWVSASGEQAIGDGRTLWFDGSWRRMGLGTRPQQVLLRPGLLWTLRDGVRMGGGYAYATTAAYGSLPTETPFREHRLWQQLSLATTLGDLGFTQRIRTEQRWIAPQGADGTGRRTFQHRLRLMSRAQQPIIRVGTDREVTVYLQDELFVTVDRQGPGARLTQNRLGVGMGVARGPRYRLDVGYMNLWNPVPSRAADEMNHTLTLTWVITGG